MDSGESGSAAIVLGTLLLSAGSLGAFLWAVRTGQFRPLHDRDARDAAGKLPLEEDPPASEDDDSRAA